MLGLLQQYRHARLSLAGSDALMLPEFELTDFPPQRTLGAEQAFAETALWQADLLLAGFVENCDGKQYSSCLIRDKSQQFLVRKSMPWPSETTHISGSGQEPEILPLSIGPTLVLICADARRFLEDSRFMDRLRAEPPDNAILVSAWLNGFDWAESAMTKLAQTLDLRHCLIIDRFHGLRSITP